MQINKEKLKKKTNTILYARVKLETKAALIKLAEKQGYGERVGQLIDAIVKEIK